MRQAPPAQDFDSRQRWTAPLVKICTTECRYWANVRMMTQVMMWGAAHSSLTGMRLELLALCWCQVFSACH